MNPLLVAAFSLLSNAVDLARVLTQPESVISFTFQNRHETDSFVILDESGAVRPDELSRLSHFVRCWRTEREKPMHPRLIEIVARTAEHFNVSELQVVSGFRARPYGAPHSKHFLGRAMDLQIPGVPAKQVAAWVWQSFRHVGVGYYPKQQFVHVDVRDDGDVRWIDMSAHGESAHARYFGRPADEAPLPAGAPRLAWDEEQETLRVAGVTRLAGLGELPEHQRHHSL
jgi:uncharacterized protein YcbK (DUF882 family)